jgi:hypothetical protein
VRYRGQPGAKDGRTQENSGYELAHDGRLPDPLHELAHEPAADEQRDYLGQEDYY